MNLVIEKILDGIVMIVKVVSGIIDFFKDMGATYVWAWNGIVQSFKNDPEFRSDVYFLAVIILVAVFYFINGKLSERTCYVIEELNSGCRHAEFNEDLQQIIFFIIRVQATALFVVQFFAFYVRPTDMFFFIAFSALYEWVMKWQVAEWESVDYDDCIQSALDFNRAREEAELDEVMRFCDLKDPEDAEKLRDYIVDMQRYRRRTGKIGDIVCVDPAQK